MCSAQGCAALHSAAIDTSPGSQRRSSVSSYRTSHLAPHTSHDDVENTNSTYSLTFRPTDFQSPTGRISVGVAMSERAWRVEGEGGCSLGFSRTPHISGPHDDQAAENLLGIGKAMTTLFTRAFSTKKKNPSPRRRRHRGHGVHLLSRPCSRSTNVESWKRAPVWRPLPPYPPLRCKYLFRTL